MAFLVETGNAIGSQLSQPDIVLIVDADAGGQCRFSSKRKIFYLSSYRIEPGQPVCPKFRGPKDSFPITRQSNRHTDFSRQVKLPKKMGLQIKGAYFVGIK